MRKNTDPYEHVGYGNVDPLRLDPQARPSKPSKPSKPKRALPRTPALIAGSAAGAIAALVAVVLGAIWAWNQAQVWWAGASGFHHFLVIMWAIGIVAGLGTKAAGRSWAASIAVAVLFPAVLVAIPVLLGIKMFSS